jgi:hypothetical protein
MEIFSVIAIELGFNLTILSKNVSSDVLIIN